MDTECPSSVQLSTPLSGRTAKLVRSSWGEYVGRMKEGEEPICEKDLVLGQFKNADEYKKFAEEALEDILDRKRREKEMDELLIE